MLADELQQARQARRSDVTPPSARGSAFDLDAAYAVERELSRRRRAEGRTVVGRKVGYANKAVWRALKLETLVWADMYDDTVHFRPQNDTTLSVAPLVAPKIEPEIVLRLKDAVPPGLTEPAAVLEAVEWIALGFEIIDCVYQDWKFQPADFVASYGLHAALIVGAPMAVDTAQAPALAEALASFKLQLLRNGEPAEQGGGRNSLRSPALCVAELATAIARRAGAEPLGAGELISSGTLAESRLIAPGEVWSATVEGLALPALTLRVQS
ncbi:MAG TPA: fumarylacetoacetate hydrolase family protein [Vicinamibacterales bacterium]|nr:fumarylacetoacetate hydrolase family protein [Vicinamibacterales bacterium]